MLGYRVFVAVALLVTAAAPAAALPTETLESLPGGPQIAFKPRAEEPEPAMSCAVASSDGPGAGVTPFLDPAAAGVRVGTDGGSVTVAAYPYSCSYVVLQLADPNRPVPREPLPEDMPFRGDFEPVLRLLLP